MVKTDGYSRGYADGYTRVARNLKLFLDDAYDMGYEDGAADRDAGNEADIKISSFIDIDYYENNDPPEGYWWTGIMRTPQKGEVYLTKAGNAGVAKSDPKNGRQRHMLTPTVHCSYYSAYPCKLAQGHPGQCSYRQVK